MVQGLIEEKKLDEFNIPQYTPSPREVKEIVESEGSFSIDRLEVTRVNWNVYEDDGDYHFTKCMRAVAEPLLVNQFGKTLMDKIFERFREIIADKISGESTHFYNVIVSMTKTVM